MYTYSCAAPPNGYYLDLWHFINVLLLIIMYRNVCLFVQQMKQQLSSMEFGRRVALEHELEKSDAYVYCNISECDFAKHLFQHRLICYTDMLT